jgi:HK97 family phage portal protein
MPNILTWLRGETVTKAAIPQPQAVEAKTTMINLFAQYGDGAITAWQCWDLYQRSSTFAQVVDLISDQVSRIEPVIQVDGKTYEDHPLLEFLQAPGYSRNRTRFVKELTVQQQVTGTGYLTVIGNVNRAPVAFDVSHSSNVVNQQGEDGWPTMISIAEQGNTRNFQRIQNGRTDFRYFNGNLAELVPIYEMAGIHKGIGQPRLQAIRSEAELRMKGVMHNLSMMDKGARLSGLLTFKDELSTEQKTDIGAQFNATASGAHNAGGVMVTSGGEAGFVPMSVNPRDMDWSNLLVSLDNSIYSRYNVPLAIFNTSSMTYNNVSSAWAQLFENAVVPTFNTIYGAIAANLSLRLGQKITITHDPLSISSLAAQVVDRETKLLGAGIVTPDEARKELGFEPIEGGNRLRVPKNTIDLQSEIQAYVESVRMTKPKQLVTVN